MLASRVKGRASVQALHSLDHRFQEARRKVNARPATESVPGFLWTVTNDYGMNRIEKKGLGISGAGGGPEIEVTIEGRKAEDTSKSQF
jgi:hypothetical protein